MKTQVPVMDIRSLEFGFDTASRVDPLLRELSFQVYKGEFVAVLGPSGCGKTTLLHLIAGLYQPVSGMVEVFSPPTNRCTILFQDLHLFYWKTALANIEVVRRSVGDNPGTASSRARDLLAQVGLDGFGGYYPHELSGGMRQRLALARTLATNATVHLLDEPFGNLDPLSERQLEKEFLRIWQEKQLTVLMVTHDIRKALRMADRVIVLTQRPTQVGSAHSVSFARPRHEQTEYDPEFLEMEKMLCHKVIQIEETASQPTVMPRVASAG